MKNSLSYRGAIRWKIVSSYNSGNFKSFCSNEKKDALVRELNFACTSAQSQPRDAKVSNNIVCLIITSIFIITVVI